MKKKTLRSSHSRFSGPHSLGCGLALALALGSCTATQPTEIVAGVSTQIRVPDELQAVGITVQAGGQVIFCNSYPVTEGFATLPATLGLRGDRNGLSDKGPITFQVIGFKNADTAFGDDCLRSADAGLEDTIVVRRRRLLFSQDRILYLPLQLKESCRDQLCGDDETCVGGECVSADIDSSTLPEYSDSLVFGTTNTCFDGNECLPKGASIPVVLEDPATCTFHVEWPEDFPPPEKGALNVRLFYKSFGTEILDLDTNQDVTQHEGFTFVDPSDPLRFRLAPSLCRTNYHAEENGEAVPRVLAVDANTFCPAKRAFQPLCESYRAPDPRVSTSDGEEPVAESGSNSESNGRCTVAGLRSVESAVYVLMDQSNSMDKFFGEKGLQFAIGLPLSSPVAKRTRVGFGLLPPDADLCGTSDYAASIPLGNVSSVQTPIAHLLQDETLLDNDPPFFLEAAVSSVYAELTAETASNNLPFNRRAVIVISNRDIASSRCPGESAVDLARAVRAREEAPIYTYAVALDDGEPGALESATELAEAGGTVVFDGVNDETEGASAVQQVLTELGTCVYDVHPVDKSAPTKLDPLDRVSYINPLSPSDQAVEIAYNAACNEDAGESVTGWNQSTDGLVRLCGTACENLRELVDDVGLIHAVKQNVAPAVPLVVTRPCGK